jgi:hypothetical protein
VKWLRKLFGFGPTDIYVVVNTNAAGQGQRLAERAIISVHARKQAADYVASQHPDWHIVNRDIIDLDDDA